MMVGRMVETLRDAVDLAQMGEEALADEGVEGADGADGAEWAERAGDGKGKEDAAGTAGATLAGGAAGAEEAARGGDWSGDWSAAGAPPEGDAGTADGAGGEGSGGDTRFAACAEEGVTWLPEIRLYGAGRGLGQGISLLGRCAAAAAPTVLSPHSGYAPVPSLLLAHAQAVQRRKRPRERAGGGEEYGPRADGRLQHGDG